MRNFTNHVLMIRPVAFGYNEQTAQNNAFQEKPESESPEEIQAAALKEFENFALKLRRAGVTVHVLEDTLEPHTPDSIFPNNWISFHEKGTIVTYPMFAENRRLERRGDVLHLLRDAGFKIDERIDWSGAEKNNVFLEGTGSMILDRRNRVAYASLSPRTNPWLLERFCSDLNFNLVSFRSVDENKQPIYHTNVLMALGDGFACLVEESIVDEDERTKVVAQLNSSGFEVIPLSYSQMNSFAGNMLQLCNERGDNVLVMSKRAYKSLTVSQKTSIEKRTSIVQVDLKTIERIGGGSARCMMAEVFLPRN